MANIDAIVLAGGISSRMGADKALLCIQGVPLLQFVCDVASGVCNTVYVVTPWSERYQHLQLKNCQFVPEVPLNQHNIDLPHGPLVGFAQGLAVVQSSWVLLLACDLPKLRVEVLQYWATELDDVSQDAVALLPRQAKGWEPLCGFYRRNCLPLLTEYINRGGRSFQAWLAQHSVQVLSVPDAMMLFNCNTPADLAVIVDG